MHASSAHASPSPSQPTTTQLSEFVSRQVAPGVVDFSVGQPAPSLLPLKLVQEAAAHTLGADSNQLLLQYAPFAGFRGFRAALAEFLCEGLGYAVSSEELMATAGVSHGVDLCVRHLLPGPSPGQLSEVYVECPTYFLAQRLFDQAGYITHHVPTDMHEGMDVDALERMLELSQRQQAAGAARRPRLLYTIPVHNNPRGTTLSEARRRKLVQLAHAHDLYVVCDDVYQLMTFLGNEVPKPLRWLEREMGLGAPGQSRVVSVSSFSKLTAPGLRLGWVEADPSLLARIKRDGATLSGGCMAALQTGIMHSALQLGLVKAHLHQVVLPTLAANRNALCQALRSELPALRWHEPQGGYFLFLELPDGVDAAKLLPHAEATHAVRFTPGSMCGPGLDRHVRLCFAFYTPDELRTGVKRLAQALRSFAPAA